MEKQQRQMTDAELAKTLGKYQTCAFLYLLFGLIGIIAGIVCYFAVPAPIPKTILTFVLFGGGLCAAIFLSGGAQKKCTALLEEGLGDFFRAEYEKKFGTERADASLVIDAAYVQSTAPLAGEWEECEIEHFHTGVHSDVPFSAANIRLIHVYERGNVQEDLAEWRDLVAQGLVLRCQTDIAASAPIHVTARKKDDPAGTTGDTAFDSRLRTDAALSSAMRTWILDLDARVPGTILCLRWEEDTLAIVWKTDYAFAAVASRVDLRDLDAARQSYRASLTQMAHILDAIHANPALYSNKPKEETL